MLGLGYIGNMDEAFSKALALISSDPGFKEKAIEALYIAVDRDWVRKDLLEVAWKNAGKELLQAIEELSNFRKSYAINIFKSEIESAISAQQEKTFEVLQERMKAQVQPPPPPPPLQPEATIEERKEEECVEAPEIEKVKVEELAKVLENMAQQLKEIKDLIIKFREDLDILKSDFNEFFDELIKNTSSLVFLAKISDSVEYGLNELNKSIKGLKEELSSLITIIKEVKEKKVVRPPVTETAEEAVVPRIKEEKRVTPPPVVEEVSQEIKEPPPVPPIKTKPSEESVVEVEEIFRSLEQELGMPEAGPEKIERYVFVAIGNSKKLSDMLRDHIVDEKGMRWRISITPDEELRYEIEIQALYSGISEDVLRELMEKSIGIIVTFPVRSTESLVRLLEKLQGMLISAKIIIVDSETSIEELEKATRIPTIYKSISSLDDLKDALIDALKRVS